MLATSGESYLARIIRAKTAGKLRWRATLPERRQRSCALKMPAGRLAYEISSEKLKHGAERRAQNETFAPVLPPTFYFSGVIPRSTEYRQVSSQHK